MKRIAILGSTGSIGVSALDVAAQFPDALSVTAISTHRNIALLRRQIDAVHPRRVGVLDQDAAAQLRAEVGSKVEVLAGAEGLAELACADDVDVVLNALVGFAGLAPTMRAIEHGKTIALANKETLVVAGNVINELLARHGGTLLPVDSEHNAIWQCLVGEERSSVRRLILTASGGPFRASHDDLSRVTVAEALAHPKWTMGRKISIDSATLMNKGLEVLEAHWLFGLPAERIDVVVHPQSIVHSMVEFTDGSIKAQLGVTDMRLPIAYALMYPHRPAMENHRLDLLSMGDLTFSAPDTRRFPCLRLAYDALRAQGTAPAVLNAANECAVEAFLAERIGFADIPRTIDHALCAVPRTAATIENIFAADAEARRVAESFIATAC